MSKLITKQYEHEGKSIDVLFTETAFFNATVAAKVFGKQPRDWLTTKPTREYIDAIAKKESLNKHKLVRVVQGGNAPGTWIHNSIKDRFMSWLERDCRNSICNDLYVLLFSTGVIKVGTSSNITNRIRQHSYESSKYGVTITRQYTELNSAVTEKELISYCSLVSNSHVGNEYFSELDFDDVVLFLKCNKDIRDVEFNLKAE